MSYQDDTQPKAPEGFREGLHDASGHLDTRPRPPAQPIPAYAPPDGSSWFNRLMMLGVLALSGGMCLTIIILSGIAGVRDELRQISTDVVVTARAGVETQYVMGIEELESGNYEMAEIRFSAIEATMPGYQDVQSRLTELEALLANTPTPAVTPTLLPAPEPTQTPSGSDEAVIQSDSGQPDPAELYGLAETAMNRTNYEEAIRWFDALVIVAPDYRRAEVQEQRLQAHLAQGRIYLRSQNEDGEDQLARGVQLINRASELGTVPGELLYEADFVARFLAARAYVEGGAYAQARDVLTRLCEEDCDWTYGSVSVRSLLAQAGGGQ